MNKQELRKEAGRKRSALKKEEIKVYSAQIFQKLIQQECYQKSEAIYCYASFREEVDTWEFMENVLREGKRLALPRVEGREISFYYILGLDDLEQGFQGIPEPQPASPVIPEKALIVVPGLAFDRKHYRIGYGGGYYDRYLLKNSHSGCRTAGVCYDFQVVEDCGPEPFDQKVDEVITPELHF